MNNVLIMALVCVLSMFALAGCDNEEQKAKDTALQKKALTKEEKSKLGGFEGMNFKPTPNKGY